MKLATVKAEIETGMKSVEFVKVDGNIKEVIFRDAGKEIRVRSQGGYTDVLNVLIPQPYEKAKRYRVFGKIAGVEVLEYFEHSFEAEDRRRQLENAVRDETAKFSVEPVDALVRDDGSVVPEPVAELETPF